MATKIVNNPLGVKKVKSFSTSTSSITSRPPIGKGFIYKITVERAGLSDAVYVGLTTRSPKERFEEHRRNANKLGILNQVGVPTGRQSRPLQFKTGAGRHHILMRTAMGTSKDRGDSNEDKYSTPQIIGEVSLAALPSAEGYFIDKYGGTNTIKPGMLNYEGLKEVKSLNEGAAGLGFSWKSYSVKVRIISSYIYYKEEAAQRFNTANELILAVASLAYQKKISSMNRIEAVRTSAVLQDWVSFGDVYTATLNNVNIKNKAQLNAIINTLFVYNTKNKDLTSVFERNKILNIGNEGIMTDYAGQAKGFSNMKSLTTEAAKSAAEAGLKNVISNLDEVLELIEKRSGKKIKMTKKR